MRMRLMAGVVAAALVGVLCTTSESTAQPENCYNCVDSTTCGVAVGWGRSEGCTVTWVCVEGICTPFCGAQGSICGIDALTMSGQVVEVSDDNPLQGSEAAISRRECDGAIVVAGEVSESAAAASVPATIILN